MTEQNTILTADCAERRTLLKTGLCVAAGAVLLPSLVSSAEAARNFAKGGSHKVSFRNAHTGESFSGVYRVGNKYLPDAFERINAVMRDFRTNEVHAMDPRVIDILYAVHRMTGSREPYEVLSGYRSPKTNAMLRKASTGVAKKSLHMEGRAVDLRLPGFSTKRLRDLGVKLQSGGVGYYSRSNFVHLDSGDVRSW